MRVNLNLCGLLALATLSTGFAHPDFSAPASPSFNFDSAALVPRIVMKAKKDAAFSDDEISGVSSRSLGISALLLDSEEEFNQTLARLQDRAEYAVRDSLVWAVGVPNDPEYRFQWSLPRVGSLAAWDNLARALPKGKSSTGRSSIIVCVADSGIDASHPDLAAILHPDVGFNAIDKNDNVKDGLKHGTHVAGIVAAIDNNAQGVAGVAADHVQVLSCKFLSDEGYGYASDAVACIDYCLSKGASIITNSWSGGPPNPAVRDAIQAAEDKGVLFVLAAGNTATNLDKEASYPASYATQLPNMLVVASTDYKDKISNFSNFGMSVVHIGAPGEWILSTVPSNTTAYYSGTSMAAPMVAGAAAMTLAASGNSLTAKELKKILMKTAEPLPSLAGKVASGGILRVDRAVAAGARHKARLSRRSLHKTL